MQDSLEAFPSDFSKDIQVAISKSMEDFLNELLYKFLMKSPEAFLPEFILESDIMKESLKTF